MSKIRKNEKNHATSRRRFYTIMTGSTVRKYASRLGQGQARSCTHVFMNIRKTPLGLLPLGFLHQPQPIILKPFYFLFDFL